jgi:hypothetical protein
MKRLSEQADFSPGLPQKKIRGVELTPQEFDTYARKSGQAAQSRIERLMNGSGYNFMSDEMKKKRIHSILAEEREKAAGSIYATIGYERKKRKQ